MSINSAMLAGVSGLVANSSALAAISDNIANVNTVGYKRTQVNFTDVVTNQSLRGRYSAGGVQGATTQYVSSQGLVQSSTSSTDVAISGDGLFVVSEGVTGDAAASRLFTRSGSFQVDDNGFLRNTGGLYLQGWPVAADGTVDANPSDMARLGPINVKDVGSVVRPSSTGQITANLNAQQTINSPALAAYNAVTNSMAAYDPVAGTGTKPDFTIQTNIIDSQGGQHTVAISFLKTNVANQWQAEIYAVPASDVTSGAGLAPGQIRAGVVAFTADGQLDTNPANTTLFADPSNPVISLGASADPAPGAGQAKWATNLGILSQQVALELDGKDGGLTQLAKTSSVKTISTNGAGVGAVTGVEIDEEGFVTAIFDNGQTRRLAQIAIATFTNPDGLRSVSGNAYLNSVQSGQYVLKQPGQGGAGSVSSTALEASTVDLSSEFAGLITTQRAYSASSKIIMTADQMLEELLNIKR